MTLKPLMSVTAELDGIYELSVIHLSSLPIRPCSKVVRYTDSSAGSATDSACPMNSSERSMTGWRPPSASYLSQLYIVQNALLRRSASTGSEIQHGIFRHLAKRGRNVLRAL